MADYIVIVETTEHSPVLATTEAGSWPRVIKVPPATQSRAITTSSMQSNALARAEHPEDWMRKEVLPKYVGCRVTLYRSEAVYVPATHSKREE